MMTERIVPGGTSKGPAKGQNMETAGIEPAQGSRRRSTPWQERFWKYVTPGAEDTCWEWQGARDHHGYGRIQRGGRNGGLIKAHRASFELHHGPIPEGAVVRHSCDNPPCVNPAHLLAGTMKDNTKDMLQRGREARIYGDANHTAKISDATVRAMRHDAAAGMPAKEVATKHGVTQTYASTIILGRRRQAAGGPIQPTRSFAEVQQDRWRRARERTGHYTVRCERCGRFAADGLPSCGSHRDYWRATRAGWGEWRPYVRRMFDPRGRTNSNAS